MKARALRRLPAGMNRTESAYALVLLAARAAGRVVRYRYEGLRLRLAEATTYTPDFVVTMADGTVECHEVKGVRGGRAWVEDDAAVKIKVAAETWPELRFLLVAQFPSGWQARDYSAGGRTWSSLPL